MLENYSTYPLRPQALTPIVESPHMLPAHTKLQIDAETMQVLDACPVLVVGPSFDGATVTLGSQLRLLLPDVRTERNEIRCRRHVKPLLAMHEHLDLIAVPKLGPDTAARVLHRQLPPQLTDVR